MKRGCTPDRRDSLGIEPHGLRNARGELADTFGVATGGVVSIFGGGCESIQNLVLALDDRDGLSKHDPMREEERRYDQKQLDDDRAKPQRVKEGIAFTRRGVR
jgi:hypothetical protein